MNESASSKKGTPLDALLPKALMERRHAYVVVNWDEAVDGFEQSKPCSTPYRERRGLGRRPDRAKCPATVSDVGRRRQWFGHQSVSKGRKRRRVRRTGSAEGTRHRSGRHPC